MKYYVVIDTNVLVSSLLAARSDSPTVQVMKAVAQKDLIPLYNHEILNEYDEVLHRKKFPFTEQRVRGALRLFRSSNSRRIASLQRAR